MRSNVKTVIRFEVMRNLKKPTFWIAALLLPLLLGGYMALAGLTGYNTQRAAEGGVDTSDMTLGVYDGADYLTTTEVTDEDGNKQTMTEYDSAEQGIEDVKSGKLGVFYAIPADFGEKNLRVQVYAKPETSSIFNRYDAPIQELLMTAAGEHVDAKDFAVLTSAVTFNTTSFSADTNEVSDPADILAKMIIPGVGLALFYVLVIMFGNRLTTAMVEEKENRISELVLTTMRPQDLITGKIISLILLGFIQLAALIVPVLILYVFGATQGFLPENIVIAWDVWTILATILLLIFSYFLFTALCITIGTLVPTAKDAGSFASVIMILVILPLFFMSSFMSEAPDTMTYVLSYFPPSAPIALMFRSTFGTLPTWELLLGLADLAIFSALIVRLAVFIFKRSALEFTAKVNVRALLAGPRSAWKAK